MVDVRIDTRGVPKGPVYEEGGALLHRDGLSAPDHAGLGLAIHESGVEAVDVASVLDLGVGFDVTEGPAGEANVALDLTEAVWTFAQGGFRFRDGAGPLLYAGASGDDLFLTGDLDVSGVAAIGNIASIEPAG